MFYKLLCFVIVLPSVSALAQQTKATANEEQPRYYEFSPCIRNIFLTADEVYATNGPEAEIEWLKKNRTNCERTSPISRRISLKYLEWGDSEYDGEGVSKKVDKKKLFEQGLHWALVALREDSTDHLNYENLSMAYAATITVSGLRRKAQLADSVRIYAEECVRIQPKNDRAYQILGRWHYEVSKLSPVLKFLSKVLFREPQDGSFEKAEEYFKKAIELDNIAGHRYWLAMSYLESGRKQEALEQFRIIVDMPVVYKNDEYFIEQAARLISKYE